MTTGSPLAGRRVVNTRALSQAGELDRLLAAHGAIPLSFPCIAIGPPADVSALDMAVSALVDGMFDQVVFTSVNTVEAVARRIEDQGLTNIMCRSALEPFRSSSTQSGDDNENGQSWWRPPAVSVVGTMTARAVERTLGWPIEFFPDDEMAASLGTTMPTGPGSEVLLPQSALAGRALAAILSGRGAEVTEVVAYETTIGAGGVDLASLLAAGEVDAVCLTSGSTARGLVDRIGGAGLPDAVRVACIGPETAEAARSLGLRVDVVPARPTMRAMVQALAASFATNETAIRG